LAPPSKAKQIGELAEAGLWPKDIAKIVYGETSRRAQKRVSAKIAKLKRKGVVTLKREKIFKRLPPSPRRVLKNYQREFERFAKRLERKFDAGELKDFLGGKEDLARFLDNWLKQQTAVMALIAECKGQYERANAAGDSRAAIGFMSIIVRLLRLSQTALEKSGIEEAQKLLHELRMQRRDDD